MRILGFDRSPHFLTYRTDKTNSYCLHLTQGCFSFDYINLIFSVLYKVLDRVFMCRHAMKTLCVLAMKQIYKITHLATNKIYIGKVAYESFR